MCYVVLNVRLNQKAPDRPTNISNLDERVLCREFFIITQFTLILVTERFNNQVPSKQTFQGFFFPHFKYKFETKGGKIGGSQQQAPRSSKEFERPMEAPEGDVDKEKASVEPQIALEQLFKSQVLWKDALKSGLRKLQRKMAA